jgi:hypothetical protein
LRSAYYNESSYLHLKILQEAMKYSDDVVNISSIRWLQDPLAEYKKNSDWEKFADIRSHIESLEVVSAAEADKVFGINFRCDLGIYHITENGGWKDDINKRKSFVDKILQKAADKSIMGIATEEGWKDCTLVVDALGNKYYMNTDAEKFKDIIEGREQEAR